MIAAATNTLLGWSLDRLPFNWFDVALLVVLGFGLFRGRKNGMSKEMLSLVEWIVVVVVAGLSCPFFTNMLVHTAHVRRATGTFILTYLAVVAVVLFIFSYIKHSLKPRLGGSNLFGSGEYYLGMISGTVRYGCMVVLFLAVLNAPVYTAAEIQAQEAYNNRWFGGGEKGFSGDYIPSFASIQEAVFRRSMLGPYLHTYLAPILINPQGAGGMAPVAAPVIHMGD